MTEQLGLFESRGDGGPADLARAPLSVRESRRARYLTLRLLPPHTLELVVPRGTRAAEVNAFVREHRQWIEDARRELERCRPVRREGLPTPHRSARHRQELATSSIGTTRRRPARCRVARLGARGRDAGCEPSAAPRPRCENWLLDEADYHLAPWLLRESQVVGRRPAQRAGAVAAHALGKLLEQRHVSLNAALLFLEPPLVRYLFIHELCHLIALNHSRRFWAAVARYEPGLRGARSPADGSLDTTFRSGRIPRAR